MKDLPVAPERELPPGRHALLKEHLLTEIRQPAADAPARRAATAVPLAPGAPGRRRWLRPAFAGPVVAGTLAVATLATLLHGSGATDDARVGRDGPATFAFAPNAGADQRAGAPQLLARIATVAGRTAAPPIEGGAIRDDQFVYVDSRVAWSTTQDGEPLKIDQLHRSESWHSVDGTRGGLKREEGEEPQRWDEVAPRPGELGYDQSTYYRHLETLPTDTDAMYRWLRKAGANYGENLNQAVFVLVGDLLFDSLMPADVTAALFRAAARIPGVVVVDEAVDAAGRHGVAIARVDANNHTRDEWIFDRKTGEYRGRRSVLLRDSQGVEAGTVTSTAAVLRRGVVDRVGQRP